MIALTTEQAQQIEEALKKTIAGCKAMGWTTVAQEQVLAAIRAARAQEQAKQEPVEGATPLYTEPQVDITDTDHFVDQLNNLSDADIKNIHTTLTHELGARNIVTSQQEKQEPVAEVNWLGASDVKWLNRALPPNGTKLYAEPIPTKNLVDVQRLQGITTLLLLVRDNLLKGMSKSIQKLQAESINEELGLSKYERSNEQCTNHRTSTAD